MFETIFDSHVGADPSCIISVTRVTLSACIEGVSGDCGQERQSKERDGREKRGREERDGRGRENREREAEIRMW